VSWLYLFAAISFEVFASMSLRASHGRLNRRWTPLVVITFVLSFGSLSLALRAGTALGVVVTVLVAHRLFGEPLTPRFGIGVGLIAVGVAVVQLGLH
jgi:small multidrug resistance pump